ncbi:MAG: UDP-N-acetylmuramate dehydrogenase [Clostridiales bacterium]|nr:UDP-N-acetylmuramate dehydrogenase [Clostridiales bacterium]
MMSLLTEKLRAVLPEERILVDEPLAAHTTFRIGGPADCFCTIESIEELQNAIHVAQELKIPWFILGRGSNLLVSDEGYRGLILHIGRGFEQVRIEGEMVTAQSGISLSALGRIVLEHSLDGFSFAAGIPGSLGGAVYMNAGAYGGEMKDILVSALVMDPEGRCFILSNEEMELGYRESIFQHRDWIVLEATLKLTPGDRDKIEADMKDLMQRRSSKQPLEYPSAGSVFKRPPGHFAGGLIEEAGLKGCQIGGARISEKHAGFIINAGEATAADVVALVRHAQDVVEQQSGVRLEPELKILKDECLIRL